MSEKDKEGQKKRREKAPVNEVRLGDRTEEI